MNILLPTCPIIIIINCGNYITTNNTSYLYHTIEATNIVYTMSNISASFSVSEEQQNRNLFHQESIEDLAPRNLLHKYIIQNWSKRKWGLYSIK